MQLRTFATSCSYSEQIVHPPKVSKNQKGICNHMKMQIKTYVTVADGLHDTRPTTGTLSVGPTTTDWVNSTFETRLCLLHLQVDGIAATNSPPSFSLLIYWQHSVRPTAVTNFLSSAFWTKSQREVSSFLKLPEYPHNTV